MVIDIYKKAVASLEDKPAKLWGLSLLSVLLTVLACSLFPAPGLSLALGWLIQVAMCMIFLRAYLGEDICIDQLFEFFRSWNTVKRVLGGIGWMTLWIFIWSLIPIVGPVFGTIRAYEYRLTPYILMKEPEIGIKDTIKVSKERTMGYKGKMFLADIIWVVAVGIAVAILFALSLINYVGWIFGLANFILIAFVLLFGIVFSGLVKSAFYVEIQKGVDDCGSCEKKTEAPETKVCGNCGFTMNASDAFCTNCGARYGAEKADEKPQEPKKQTPVKKRTSIKSEPADKAEEGSTETKTKTSPKKVEKTE